MTANDSSSSATEQPERLDLVEAGWLPPLPTAFLGDRDRDLLAPLSFLPPGELPSGDPPTVDRVLLAEGLAQANAGYGHPRAAQLAAKLADPATRVVVTGQQPGLFCGPLLTLTKMAAAARWAAALEAAGQPAVAVFWVATEDHDWAEVAQAGILARGEFERIDLGDDPAALLPVGMRALGGGLEQALARLAEVQPGERGQQWHAELGRWYRPNARFGEAFARLAVHLLGERTPLLLDSMLPAVKQAQRPWLRRLVEERDAVDAALTAADQPVEDRGYPLQVRPQPGLSPLFLLQGQERRRIEWRDGERFGLRGLADFEQPVERLLDTIDENPAAVSPGVLARPAIQDAILGTTLQIMGPAELSYMTQVAGIYRHLGLEAPHTTLRPQAMVLEPRPEAQLKELGIALPRLLTTPVERLLSDSVGGDLVGPARETIEETLDQLQEAATQLDAGLERPWRKTRDQIGRALDQLASKVAGANARRHQVSHQRLERIHADLLPGGKPQERVLSIAHFGGRYGRGIADALYHQIGLDPSVLHLVRPDQGPSR
nr:putative cysteine ligase BshC [Nerophis lumbriciformis]